MPRTLVVGATGTTGGLVASELLARGEKVRALVRRPERAAYLAEQGVELIVGDVRERAALSTALDGVQRAYLALSAAPEQVDVNREFIEAAEAGGLEQLVRLSAVLAAPDSEVELLRLHHASDEQLAGSELRWTILRPHMFMQNFLGFAMTIKAHDAFYAPMRAARIGLVDARDIAAVAATVLCEGGHDAETLVLTGPQSLSFEAAAGALSDALGRTIRYTDVDAASARGGMLQAGMPEWLADNLLSLYGLLGSERGDFVTDVVERVTGNVGHSFATFAGDYASAF